MNFKEDNVTLFSWEYFSILLKNNIKENININLSSLWNLSVVIAETTIFQNKNDCFLFKQNEFIKNILIFSNSEF